VPAVKEEEQFVKVLAERQSGQSLLERLRTAGLDESTTMFSNLVVLRLRVGGYSREESGGEENARRGTLDWREQKRQSLVWNTPLVTETRALIWASNEAVGSGAKVTVFSLSFTELESRGAESCSDKWKTRNENETWSAADIAPPWLTAMVCSCEDTSVALITARLFSLFDRISTWKSWFACERDTDPSSSNIIVSVRSNCPTPKPNEAQGLSFLPHCG
jgi:hypothetical protein